MREPRPLRLTALPVALAAGGESGNGAVWRLAESGRELDANLVRLPPGARVGEHRERVLDILLLVVEGSGAIGREPVVPGVLIWLPRGAARTVAAGPKGLAYLTVHRRRPGMSVGRPASAKEQAGGEAACFLHLVCPACAHVAEDRHAAYCSRCGERLGG